MIKKLFYLILHNLSIKLASSGISGFKPFLFLISEIIVPVLEVGSNGSPLISAQCEKTHYGKAYPAVAPLSAAVNPKDSQTGKKALTIFNGVPQIYSSSLTIPLL